MTDLANAGVLKGRAIARQLLQGPISPPLLGEKIKYPDLKGPGNQVLQETLLVIYFS
jgi:hypothetical protein